MAKPKTSNTPKLLFLLVLVASILFRVTNLDLIEFKADEAINLFLASRPLFGHPLPPGSTVSSIGLLNPPLLNYLLYPLTLISLDPKTISFFIGLINSFTIGFFFLLIKRYYSQTKALIASLLFAFSPWAILYSRKIWTQDLLLPFFVLLLFCLHKILIDKKMIYWPPYIVVSLFLLQLHQSTIFLLVLINFFLLLRKPKLHFPYIISGVVLGLLPMVSYLAYLFKNINTDPTAFLVAKERFGRHYFPIIFFRPLQITSQGNFHFILGSDTLTFAQNFPFIYKLRKLFYLEYLLLPIGVILFWKKQPRFRFLVYAAVLLPLAYFLLHFEPFIHYFIILTPLLFLFLASAFTHFLRSKNKKIKTVSLLILSSLIFTSLAYNFAFFDLLKQQKSLKGDYGIVFEVIEEKAKKRFAKYEDDVHYQEMLLASYLPKNLIYGYLPVGKMIYPPQETKKNLPALEKRLKQVPEDARVQNELLSFYTSSPITVETINLLKQKSQELPGYKVVFDEVYQVFVKQNSKPN